MFEQVKVPVLGIVENMSYFICDGCEKQHDIFPRGGGKRAAEQLGVPFLGEIPIEGSVSKSGDAGLPVVAAAPDSAAARAFTAMAGEVARQLATRSMQAEASGELSMSWQS